VTRNQEELEKLPRHIIEAITAIESYMSESDIDEFRRDVKTQDAVLYKIVVVGEAGGDIGRRYPDFVDAHPELQFIQAYRMRNRVAHGYATIDIGIVWHSAQVDLPKLTKQILRLYPHLSP
jgi:uncharacterized protein with HEPN domain